MNYFLDTNVPTGYTVPHDKWHESSVNFIENTSCPFYLKCERILRPLQVGDEFHKKRVIIM